jgi:uncharacterized membrane protein YqjE
MRYIWWGSVLSLSGSVALVAWTFWSQSRPRDFGWPVFALMILGAILNTVYQVHKEQLRREERRKELEGDKKA